MYNRSIVSTVSLALLLVAGSGQSPAQQMPDMGEQMARMSGSLHAIARACGEATDAELAQNKRAQKANHGKFGMNPATFDSGFEAGETEAEAHWKSLSPAQQQESCREIKQQWKDAARALGVGQG